MDALIVGCVGDDDVDEVIEFTRHQEALDDLGDVSDGFLERVEINLILFIEGDVHEDVAGKSDALRIDDRDVSRDDAGVFECTRSAKARRLGESDERCQADIWDAPIPLQHVEDRAVDLIDIHVMESFKL